MKIVNYLVFLFSMSVTGQNNKTIHADFSGLQNELTMTLEDCLIKPNTIVSKKIVSNKVILEIPYQINDGVYKLLLKTSANNNETTMIKSFYLIIDKSENKIAFSYNFDKKKDTYPVFSISEINKNWYEFIRTNNFKLTTINPASTKLLTTSLGNNFDNKNVALNECIEIINDQQQFIKANFNKWSTAMVKAYSVTFKPNINKENYWSFFETNNPQLINAPIFQDAVQNYFILYYNPISNQNDSLKKNLKEGFENVINAFSKNYDTKSWAVSYTIEGLRQINDKELVDYFLNKNKY
ncbi:hypothetical protein [Flavobacterium sp.]